MENDKISNSLEYTILKEQLEERFNKLNEIVKLINNDIQDKEIQDKVKVNNS